MKNIVLFILLQIVLLPALLAQSSVEEHLFIEHVRINKFIELSKQQLKQSKAIIIQTGEANSAIINQTNTGNKPNNAIITQIGSLNQSTLIQQGLGNKLAATQEGTNNAYNVYMEGYRNTSTIIQTGSGNEISQIIEGRGLEYTLIQEGHNNTITQIESSLNSRPYKVVQLGNNMNITIEQSNWGVPVTITATKK